jgi:hypothetical protein
MFKWNFIIIVWWNSRSFCGFIILKMTVQFFVGELLFFPDINAFKEEIGEIVKRL